MAWRACIPIFRHIRPGTAVLLAVAGLVYGCAHTKPDPLPGDVIQSLGTVGVVSTEAVGDEDIDTPAAGGAEGAARGSVLGITTLIGGGANSGQPEGLAIALILTPVGALVGAVYGAYTAESGEKVDEAVAAINEAAAGYDVRDDLRGQVCEQARALSGYTVPDAGRLYCAAGKAGPEYGSLKDKGIDTALVLSVARFGLEGAKLESDPPMKLVLVVRARLVRTANGEELYAETYRYESREQMFLDWAAGAAAKFRHGSENACRQVGSDIVADIFQRGCPLPPIPHRD